MYSFTDIRSSPGIPGQIKLALWSIKQLKTQYL